MATDIGSIRFTIEADSSDLQRADAALDDVSTSADRAAKSTRRYSQSTNRAGAVSKKATGQGIRPMRGAMGQLGFQVQDVAVQLQSGTNAMLVFGQQGSQIASIFGPGGAVIGAILAVGSALAGAFFSGAMKAEESADDLIDRIKELTDEFKNVTAAQNVFLRQQFVGKIEERESSIRSARESIEELRGSIQALEREQRIGGGPAGGIVDNTQEIRDAREEITRLNATISTDQQEIDKYSGTIQDLTEILVESGEAEEERAKRIKESKESLDELVSSLQLQAETIGLTARETAVYEAARLNANEADLASINASFDRIEAYKREQEQLKQLREQTKITAAEDFTLQRVAADDRAQDVINQQRKEAEAVKRGLDQEFAIRQAHKERVMALRAGLRAGVIEGERELQRLIIESTEQRNEELSALEQNRFKVLTDTQQDALGAIGETFGNFADVARQGGKESFQQYQNLASAEAAIAGSLAVIKALGAAPPPINIALAASIGTLAAAQIAQIQSQEYTGARVNGGQVQPGESYLVGERGPEMFTPNVVGAVSSNRSMQGGGVTIINQTTGRIDKAEERRLPSGERAIIIQEAVNRIDRNLENPNSSTSRSLAKNTTARRQR